MTRTLDDMDVPRDVARRNILKGAMGVAAAAVGLAVSRRANASVCLPTPAQTEGPFYPLKHQLDEDSDLTWVETRSQRAKGQVAYVQGQVTDDACQPVERALVEIWQACSTGRYDHASDDNPAALDPNFQYWGRSITDAQGRYAFKTIVPGAYPAAPGWIRPPHIHFTVNKRGFVQLTTQMYFAGNRYNAADKILQSLPPEAQRQVVIAATAPGAEHDPGAQIYTFDLHLQAV